MYRTYRVEQPRQDVGHVAAQEAILPQQLLLLLRDLGQRVALLDVSQQRELGAAGGGLWRGRCLLLAEVSMKFLKNNHYIDIVSALLPAWCRAWRGTRRTPGSGRRRGRRWGGSRSRTRRTGWATLSWGWCRCCPAGSAGRRYPWAHPTGSNWTGKIGYKYKCVLACASETATDL